jgi:MFS family permease
VQDVWFVEFARPPRALPQMRAALHMSSTGQQWVVNAYALTFAGFLMLGGRAADLFGRKRVFLIGLAAFTLFSFLGGLAQGFWERGGRPSRGPTPARAHG